MRWPALRDHVLQRRSVSCPCCSGCFPFVCSLSLMGDAIIGGGGGGRRMTVITIDIYVSMYEVCT